MRPGLATALFLIGLAACTAPGASELGPPKLGVGIGIGPNGVTLRPRVTTTVNGVTVVATPGGATVGTSVGGIGVGASL